jgi:hypothetical protein
MNVLFKIKIKLSIVFTNSLIQLKMRDVFQTSSHHRTLPERIVRNVDATMSEGEGE